MAGLSKKQANEMKVKYIDRTDNITKELFDNLVPLRMDRINFRIEILKKFNLELAVERNESFKYFVKYFACTQYLAVL